MTDTNCNVKVFFMKKFILIIIIFFSFQSWTKADNIKELEIEGISIGDNALDFFSKDIIDENIRFYPNNKNFFRTHVTLNNNEFNSVQMHIKNDDKYIVYAVAGLIFYDRNDPKEKC